ncbi:hypothetical protein [Streptomyces sp. CS081A]|uniref:hypothetical protein n=1 Tax=Streptomyces sp. CS081A TaxID=2162709 RepID=UPI001951E78C|nr:hypothetical protein [Streptomyces sp. CS081A]
MENFKVAWMQDGEPKRSTVAYDRPSAEDRKARLEREAGVSDVKIVKVKPGE